MKTILKRILKMQKGERSKENKEWPSKISDRSEKQKTKAIRSKKD